MYPLMLQIISHIFTGIALVGFLSGVFFGFGETYDWFQQGGGFWLVGVLPLTAVGMWHHVHSSWKQVASELGLEHIPGGLFQNQALRGVLHDVPVEVSSRYFGGKAVNRRYYIRINAKLNANIPHQFELQGPDASRTIRQFLNGRSSRQWQFLTRRSWVKPGLDREETRRFLTSEMSNVLDVVLKRYSRVHWSDGLIVSHYRCLVHSATLHTWILSAVDNARRINRAQKSSHVDVSGDQQFMP